jgi:RNA polymerase sigma-70 factor, ECF subfamily
MRSTAEVSKQRQHLQAAGSPGDFGRHIASIDLQSLRRLAVQLGRNVSDPDDLLQDTLERACRNFHQFDPTTNLHAWLRTIMHRLVIDDWRKRGGRREVPTDDLVAPEPAEPEPVWSRYTLDEVRRASLQLREPLRTTFRLRLVDGLCYTAIAQRQGIPPSTVATRLMRSRRQVRDLLEGGKVSPLRLVGKTDGPEEPSSDKACDQWFPLHHPPAPSRAASGQATASRPSPMRSRVVIGGRC